MASRFVYTVSVERDHEGSELVDVVGYLAEAKDVGEGVAVQLRFGSDAPARDDARVVRFLSRHGFERDASGPFRWVLSPGSYADVVIARWLVKL